MTSAKLNQPENVLNGQRSPFIHVTELGHLGSLNTFSVFIIIVYYYTIHIYNVYFIIIHFLIFIIKKCMPDKRESNCPSTELPYSYSQSHNVLI